jgi:hypothetical protein
MPLRPWVGSEPVEVTNHLPSQIQSTLLLYSRDVKYGTLPADIVWMGPSVNTTWEIVSFIVELQTTAAVGNRGVYQYIMDRDTNTSRFELYSSAAAFINKIICQHGLPGSVVASAIERTITQPCYVDRLDYPCRLGVLLSDFDGTDICTFKLLVRESTQVG